MKTYNCILPRGVRRRMVLAGMVIAGAIGFSSHAEDDMVGAGDMRPGFSVITREQMHMYAVTPLWENRLRTFHDTDGNQEVFNLFIIGNTVYAYIDYYEGPERDNILLKRFSLDTGRYLGNLSCAKSDIPVKAFDDSSNASTVSVSRDDAGHIVFTQLSYCVPTPVRGAEGCLSVAVFDSELKLLNRITATEGIGHTLRFLKYLSQPRIEGDAAAGDFRISYSGWSALVEGEDESTASLNQYVAKHYYPSVVSFDFSDSGLTGFSPVYFEFTGDYRAGTDVAGKLAEYHLPEEKTVNNENNPSYYLYTQDMGGGRWMVQRYNGPLMLFEDKGRKITVNGREYPLMSQSGNTAGGSDGSSGGYDCFPAAVKLTDRVAIFRMRCFDRADGFIFAAYDMPDSGDLSTAGYLTDLNRAGSFPAPTEIYKAATPFVGIVKHTGSDTQVRMRPESDNAVIIARERATVVTYFPGSGLGAYAVEVCQSDRPTGLLSLPRADGLCHTLKGRTLTLAEGCPDEELRVELYTMSGIRLLSETARPGESVCLDAFHEGIYCLRVGLDTSTIRLAE